MHFSLYLFIYFYTSHILQPYSFFFPPPHTHKRKNPGPEIQWNRRAGNILYLYLENYLKSATKPFNVLLACTHPLITEFALSLQKKEHCVLCHEGFGQSVPPKTIVHVIEDSFLSSICFTLPLINKDRVQFELNAIDFLSFPTSESKDVIVEQTAAVSTDIIVSIAVCCGGGRPPLRFLFLISDCEFLQRIE